MAHVQHRSVKPVTVGKRPESGVDFALRLFFVGILSALLMRDVSGDESVCLGSLNCSLEVKRDLLGAPWVVPFLIRGGRVEVLANKRLMVASHRCAGLAVALPEKLIVECIEAHRVSAAVLAVQH